MVEMDFHKVEKKWQEKWDKNKVFVSREKGKDKFYVLEMFPYPSGAGLHMGHALNYSIGDIYARFKRMNGFNVLYPMGYDSLGLPAENAAIKNGTHPKDYTEKSIKNFIKQQKGLGLSYDWDRIINTSDSEYYRWDQWIFLKMLEKGLAYKKKSAVNYCKKCDSVLANEQVHNGKCWVHTDTEIEIRHLEQWYFKITNYVEELNDFKELEKWPDTIKKLQRNWIGKSFGTEIDFEINGEKWAVFTTRADTIYGVTFMVVSAQHTRLMELVTHERKKDVENFLKRLKSVSEKEAENMEKEGVFTGSYAINPLTKERVPVYAGNFVLADYGSGMVMAVPAHDQRDFEFAKKYGIEIKEVIEPEFAKYLVVEKSLPKIKFEELGRFGKIETEEVDKDWGKLVRVSVIKNKEKEFISFLEKNLIVKSNEGWYADSMGTSNIVVFSNKHFKISNKEDYNEFVKYGISIGIPKKQLDIKMRAYTEEGKLVNSGEFNGINNREAIVKISEYLEKKKLGKRCVNYKLRDWLISRQRYWGTPIPVINCPHCGVVGVKEKDLPVELPYKVKFGKGNPLETNENWVKAKCPKCGEIGRRETDTMDTFVNSSWYYLRYTDSKNNKAIFKKESADYWCPVDFYIGGKEHACMHLIYIRFYTKFLRDLGLLNFNEPALRLFNQGMLHAEDGNKMSKSLGNVVDPLDVIGKYSADSLRLFLVSVASPDSDMNWSDKGVEGSFKLVRRIVNYVESVKISKSSKRIESKINKGIKRISEDIENLKYNLAVIKLRGLFESFEDEISKKDLESFLKMLSVFCPHVAEELFERINGKGFISLSKWPECDESKIDEKLEKAEENLERTISDIMNVLGILKEKGKEAEKVYLYVLPVEKEFYDSEKISKRIGKDVRVFSSADKSVYDPENKKGKAKFGKPGIYVE